MNLSPYILCLFLLGLAATALGLPVCSNCCNASFNAAGFIGSLPLLYTPLLFVCGRFPITVGGVLLSGGDMGPGVFASEESWTFVVLMKGAPASLGERMIEVYWKVKVLAINVRLSCSRDTVS